MSVGAYLLLWSLSLRRGLLPAEMPPLAYGVTRGECVALRLEVQRGWEPRVLHLVPRCVALTREAKYRLGG